MKKQLLIALTLLTVGTINVSAQLKVASSGEVYVGDAHATYLTSNGLYSVKTSGNNYYNSAINGRFSSDTTPTNSSIGVLGSSDSNGGSHNYGVAGLNWSSTNGTGIYGTDNSLLTNVTGKYAGFFDGSTKVVGTLTATNVVTTSDIRLKQNVESLSNSNSGNSTLENVMGMDVITYNLKLPRQYDEKVLEELGKEIPAEAIEAMKKREKTLEEQKHFGLSAQDLQQIYPELVYEGQDGYLAVNYTELVPILIRSIQELKQELDEVKSNNAAQSRTATAIESSTANSGNVLYQNTPNPFKEKTIIHFTLADDACNAAICIFDLSGKLIKKLPVSRGDTSVKVNGYELGEGMFLYTLMVEGQEIDTKRMIITK